MSHVATIDVEIRDLQALKDACKELGYAFCEGQQTYAWYGQWVGDTAMPEGMTVADLGHCEHAIKVPGCSYEVGVRRNPTGGYRLAFDYWSSGGLNRALGGPAAPKLKQAYAVAAAVRQARQRGFRVTKAVRADGSVKLVLSK